MVKTTKATTLKNQLLSAWLKALVPKGGEGVLKTDNFQTLTKLPSSVIRT